MSSWEKRERHSQGCSPGGYYIVKGFVLVSHENYENPSKDFMQEIAIDHVHILRNHYGRRLQVDFVELGFGEKEIDKRQGYW